MPGFAAAGTAVVGRVAEVLGQVAGIAVAGMVVGVLGQVVGMVVEVLALVVVDTAVVGRVVEVPGLVVAGSGIVEEAGVVLQLGRVHNSCIYFPLLEFYNLDSMAFSSPSRA